MHLPEQFFILAGAPKSGTTSLAHWLDKRPDMRLHPQKEPKFFTDFARFSWNGPGADDFARGIVVDELKYLEAFGDCAPGTWAIDASTEYLWCEASAAQIYHWSKRYRVKVAFILRHPVQRAISEYLHTIRDHLQDESLCSSLQKEDQRLSDRWLPLFYHTRRSRYYEQINRYRDVFGDDLLLLDYEELKAPDKLNRKIAAFLDLPDLELPPLGKQNVSTDYRSRTLDRMLAKGPVVELGRALVPQKLRKPIRGLITGISKKKYRPSETELECLSSALSDEITNCRQDPFFPTDGWRDD